MLKFKFDYLYNSLAYQKEDDLYADVWNYLAEERQFQGDFGSLGFKLDHGWISFTIYENKIRAFYKCQEAPAWVTYYRKDLPKEAPITFTFTEQDEVEKTNGKWRRKHE